MIGMLGASGRQWARRGAIWAKVLIGIGFVVVVIVLMMWLAGSFHHKIDASKSVAAVQRPAKGVPTAVARTIRVPAIESAVGTIRAVHETSVASKLLAKVIEVNVTAGQAVEQGEVLVRLDDQDLRARLEQAGAAVDHAVAARDQARIEFERTEKLHQAGQATQIEFDRASTAIKAAEAERSRAEEARNEAAAVLDYATIRAPIAGTIIDKQVEVGDTAKPGQVLLTLYDPTRMQLVARVRESLASRLRVGQTVDVGVDALKKVCQGRVSEIVPEAESASRSFSVKVTGPCPEGIYSGMFGRMRIPLDEREVLVVPRAAVRRVGQLDLVEVVAAADGQRVLQRRAVQLGEEYGDDVQVLSGLTDGEEVALPQVST